MKTIHKGKVKGKKRARGRDYRWLNNIKTWTGFNMVDCTMSKHCQRKSKPEIHCSHHSMMECRVQTVILHSEKEVGHSYMFSVTLAETGRNMNKDA